MSEPAPQDLRRQEERQRRRDEILDAAGAVFTERSFESATMDDIARRARVSRALVYVYFRDKEALYMALCERALHNLRALFEQAVAEQPSGREAVRAIGRAYIRFAEEYPCQFQALSHFEARTADPEKADPELLQLMDAGRAVHEVTVQAIHRGMQDGSLRSDLENPLQTSMTLWGFTHGVVQIAQHKQHVIMREGIAIDRFREDALSLALQALEPR